MTCRWRGKGRLWSCTTGVPSFFALFLFFFRDVCFLFFCCGSGCPCGARRTRFRCGTRVLVRPPLATRFLRRGRLFLLALYFRLREWGGGGEAALGLVSHGVVVDGHGLHRQRRGRPTPTTDALRWSRRRRLRFLFVGRFMGKKRRRPRRRTRRVGHRRLSCTPLRIVLQHLLYGGKGGRLTTILAIFWILFLGFGGPRGGGGRKHDVRAIRGHEGSIRRRRRGTMTSTHGCQWRGFDDHIPTPRFTVRRRRTTGVATILLRLLVSWRGVGVASLSTSPLPPTPLAVALPRRRRSARRKPCSIPRLHPVRDVHHKSGGGGGEWRRRSGSGGVFGGRGGKKEQFFMACGVHLLLTCDFSLFSRFFFVLCRFFMSYARGNRVQ